jgi:uncharacterized protein
MSDSQRPAIRVITPADLAWEEAAHASTEVDPPGREATVVTSPDGRFSVGLWERDGQRRAFERPYHEVAYILEGYVEITDERGAVLVAKPGDFLDTPKGSRGYWKNLTPVKKVWAILED